MKMRKLYPRAGWRHTAAAALWISLAVLTPLHVARALCCGDCNNDGAVTIDEILLSVNIALEAAPVGVCPSIDIDNNRQATMDEILLAVIAALEGCPTPIATATAPATPTASPTFTASPTDTATPTVTATPTINQPPVAHALPVYRTYPGMPIAVPLPVEDPEGDPLSCELLDAPSGAVLQPAPPVFVWTPAAEQLGPFYPRFVCSDANSAGPAASGGLVIKVSPPDSCTQPRCDAAAGCTSVSLPPVEPNCCTPPTTRVAEPEAGCPQGRVIFVGANRTNGFGRLQNCDALRVYNFAQNSAVVRLHIEGRCINTEARPLLHARMETAYRVVFDQSYRIPFNDRGDGYAELIGAGFQVEGDRPYYDLQDAEANLTVSLIDADNIESEESLRVVLTFSPVPEQPDLERTPTPLPEIATPSPTPSEVSPTPIDSPE